MNFNQNAAVKGGNSFKASWMWIILKMGQEVEEEEGGGGRLVYQEPPLPASCVYLSCGRGLML